MSELDLSSQRRWRLIGYRPPMWRVRPQKLAWAPVAARTRARVPGPLQTQTRLEKTARLLRVSPLRVVRGSRVRIVPLTVALRITGWNSAGHVDRPWTPFATCQPNWVQPSPTPRVGTCAECDGRRLWFELTGHESTPRYNVRHARPPSPRRQPEGPVGSIGQLLPVGGSGPPLYL